MSSSSLSSLVSVTIAVAAAAAAATSEPAHMAIGAATNASAFEANASVSATALAAPRRGPPSRETGRAVHGMFWLTPTGIEEGQGSCVMTVRGWRTSVEPARGAGLGRGAEDKAVLRGVGAAPSAAVALEEER